MCNTLSHHQLLVLTVEVSSILKFSKGEEGGVEEKRIERRGGGEPRGANIWRGDFQLSHCFVDPYRLYAHTQSSLALLERVSICVASSEPVLLVGETGVGKTATISYLAQLTGM